MRGGRGRTMIVLGIESSCDETAAAVLADGRRILSSVVASQDAIHAPYGGVVPELASRRHLEVIVPVVDKALADAGVRLPDLDGIAVTQGPGLVGSLLVGCSVAKSLAYVHRLPLVAVNHLEGHIYAAFLTDDPPVHPFLALVVSGGHTALYHARAPLTYALVGHTRDDADGEASFQATVVKMLVRKTVKAALHHGVKRVVLTGGVAANTPLREALDAAAIDHGLRLHIPPRSLCTDNAAMITAAGTARLAAGERAPLTMNAAPDLRLA